MKSFVLCLCLFVAFANAARIISDVFSDGMVLQAAPNTAVLFGENAEPNSVIPIYLDNVIVARAKADSNGKWTARLAPVAASNTPRDLRVGGELIRGVLFGNVFVCAGQKMVNVAETRVGMFMSNSNVRSLHVSEKTLAGKMNWEVVNFGSDNDACLNMGLSVSQKTGLPVGLVQAVYDAPLASFVPAVEKSVATNSAQCSQCSYDEKAWNAVMRHIVPMRFRSFVWVGDDSKSDRCVESKCVHDNLAKGIRSKFTTNNLLLRTLRDDPFTIIGHRGMPSSCPENTIVSQVVARKAGTRWIEDDTQPSKDNVPFVLHDGTVDRTTNGHGAIRDLTYAELKALDAGSWFHPIFTGTRLPTLAEQLEDLSVNGGNLLLEIKGSHSYNEVQDIISLLKKYNMTKRVLVQSFDRPSIQYSYQIAPEIPIGLLISNIEDDPLATCKNMHLSAYNPDYRSVLKRPEVVSQLHKNGVIMFTWSPDTASDWANLKKIGVDGIITNRATQLQGWVSAIMQMENYYDSSFGEAVTDNESVLESDDAKIIISSDVKSVASSKFLPNFVIAPRGADLAALALQ